MGDGKFRLPKAGENLDLLTGEITTVSDILNEQREAERSRLARLEKQKNMLCKAMHDYKESAKQIVPEDSGDAAANNVRRLYDIVISNEGLKYEQHRALEAVILKSLGVKAKEIFSKLQPDDKLQKDPARVARRWVTQGKALAKKLNLPQLIE